MKKRLDVLIFEKGYAKSREEAKRLILSGNVLVAGHVSDKVGMLIDENLQIEVKEKFPYVSRGALKLEKAYQEFGIDLKNKIVCDIGASTGGFTDFALQKGAKKVYAIDVGYGQLDQKLRNDSRVINMERTNIRDLDTWEKFQDAVKAAVSKNVIPELRHEVGNIRNPEDLRNETNSWIPASAGMTNAEVVESVQPIDIFVMDLSFISLKSVLPVIYKLLVHSSQFIEGNPKTQDPRPMTQIVALIKPQFEVGKKIADKCKGVIKDETIREEVVEDIKQFAKSLGFEIKGVTDSPILGAKGNKEFLMYLTSN